MLRKRVTIPDLARELGLSVGTVSNALNDKGRVSPETRELVVETARQRGYSRNQSAAALRTGRHDLVSVYLPRHTADLSFYMEFTIGLSISLGKAGVDLLIASPEANQDRRSGIIDGAVVVDWNKGLQAPLELLAAGIPVLAADGVPDDSIKPTAIVSTDYHELVRNMTSAAIASGAKRPLLVAPDEFDTAWQHDIITGFQAACREVEVEAMQSSFPVGGTATELIELLERVVPELRPDCLVFGGQRLAGIAHVTFGYGEPDSAIPWLVSCAGDPLTEISSPVITAADPAPLGFGQRCGQVLLHIIESGQPLPNTIDWPAQVTWAEHWTVTGATQ